ncbi:MAG: hypothetical protein RJB56_1168 [Actinomycetota bacterium]
MPNLSTRFRIFFLSTVVTKLIKAPAVLLSERNVPEAVEVFVETRHGKVRCLITRPASDAPLNVNGLPPVHINMHGGAYLIGAPEQDNHFIKGIAGEVGAVVVNVDYSRGPKVRYPVAQEQCFDVLKWVAESGDKQGWDGTRISMGGGSAGAHLALGVIEMSRVETGPKVRSAALVVPPVDMTAEPSTYVSSYAKAMVSPALVETMLAAYFPEQMRRKEHMASPLLGTDEQLKNLPPLLVVSAEFDTLKPGIEKFVARLKPLGVDVSYREFVGYDHDFPVRADAGDVQKELAGLIHSHLLKTLAK